MSSKRAPLYKDVDALFSAVAYEVRPFFILSNIYPITTAIIALGSTPPLLSLDAWIIVLVFLCFAFLEGGSNIWNNLNDVREDKVSKPTTLAVMGVIPPDIGLRVSAMLYVIGLVFSLYLWSLLGKPWVFIFYVIFAVLSFLYSDKKYTKINIKARGWLGPLAIAVGFTGIAVTGLVAFRDLNLAYAVFLAHIFMLILSIAPLKDYRDIEGDLKAGVITPAAKDPVGTMKLSCLFGYVSLLLLLASAYLNAVPWTAVVLAAPAWLPTIKLGLEGDKAVHDAKGMMLAFIMGKIVEPILLIVGVTLAALLNLP